ncbi:MAG: GspE/PulE family protein [Verrucomicrobiales bacterium]
MNAGTTASPIPVQSSLPPFAGASRGLQPAGMEYSSGSPGPVGGVGLGLMSLEGTAVQFGILPVKFARAACGATAEGLLRKLGRFPRSDKPWLPVTTIGPLIVFAHCNPKEDDLWGVPSVLAVKVAVSAEQYQQIRQDLVSRMANNPLPRENALETLDGSSLRGSDLDTIFAWLLEHYPYDPQHAERLSRNCEEAVEKNGFLDARHYNAFEPGLGVALQYLATGPSLLCFNPEEAPRQETYPTPLLEKHVVYPIHISERRIYLLTEDPDVYAFEDEWVSSGHDPVEIVPVLADPKLIRAAISRTGGSVSMGITIAEVDKDFAGSSEKGNVVEIVAEDVAAVNPANVNHTAEQLLHWVLYTAISLKASDLHIERYYNLVRFRARIDGKLKVLYTASDELLVRFVALIKNACNMTQNRQDSQDARFSIVMGKRRVDVRVAAIPVRLEFQKITMRFLDKQDGMKDLAELNLSKRQNSLFKRAMGRDQGLILVTGPTGSGKTTTLYALINSVNDEFVNIQTIEDPIEYELEGINQTQTDNINGLTFSTGLRALMRADPDIILIGECRDQETAQAAVNASLTGHLVLTTLHANDSLRAISRICSMGVEPYLLADSLALSQAQRLVRRLCNYCKRPVEARPEVQEIMAKLGIINGPLKDPVYTAQGCPECHGTGYRGRVSLMELCEISSHLADLIENKAPMSEMRLAAAKAGVLTLYQEGLLQVLAGNTTMEEIQEVRYTAG